MRELRELGYTEGRNLILDVRHGEWQFDRLPALATDLARLKVDVIVALGDPAIQAAKQSTSAIPIVMVGSADPVGLGFVASLGRPGGNVTGMSSNAAELAEKRLDLLKQAVPRLGRVMVLARQRLNALMAKRIQKAGRALGVTLLFEEVHGRVEVERVFAAIAGERRHALLVFGTGLEAGLQIRIAQLAREHRIPVISDSIYLTTWDGLMSYATSYAPLAKRAAYFVDISKCVGRVNCSRVLAG